jgi:hypothetical protein
VASAFGGRRPPIYYDCRELPTIDDITDIVDWFDPELSVTSTQVAINSLRRATLVLPALIEQEQANWRMVESPKDCGLPESG